MTLLDDSRTYRYEYSRRPFAELLIDAIKHQLEHRVKSILMQQTCSINVNCRLRENALETPLLIACRMTSSNDMNAKSDDSIYEIIHCLLKYGAEPNVFNITDGWTPLHLVCKSANFKILKLLLQNQAHVNSQAYDGKTPLHLLCYGVMDQNTFGCIQLLLANQAKVNVLDDTGSSPLLAAIMYGSGPYKVPSIRLLLKNQADMNIPMLQNYLRQQCFAHLRERWVPTRQNKCPPPKITTVFAGSRRAPPRRMKGNLSLDILSLRSVGSFRKGRV